MEVWTYLGGVLAAALAGATVLMAFAALVLAGTVVYRLLEAEQGKHELIIDGRGNWYLKSRHKTRSFEPGPESRIAAEHLAIVPAGRLAFVQRPFFIRRYSVRPRRYAAVKRALRLRLGPTHV